MSSRVLYAARYDAMRRAEAGQRLARRVLDIRENAREIEEICRTVLAQETARSDERPAQA